MGAFVRLIESAAAENYAEAKCVFPLLIWKERPHGVRDQILEPQLILTVSYTKTVAEETIRCAAVDLPSHSLISNMHLIRSLEYERELLSYQKCSKTCMKNKDIAKPCNEPADVESRRKYPI